MKNVKGGIDLISMIKPVKTKEFNYTSHGINQDIFIFKKSELHLFIILYLADQFSFMFCHNFRLRNRKLRQNGADIFCTTGLTRGMAKPLFHRFNTRGY